MNENYRPIIITAAIAAVILFAIIVTRATDYYFGLRLFQSVPGGVLQADTVTQPTPSPSPSPTASLSLVQEGKLRLYFTAAVKKSTPAATQQDVQTLIEKAGYAFSVDAYTDVAATKSLGLAGADLAEDTELIAQLKKDPLVSTAAPDGPSLRIVFKQALYAEALTTFLEKYDIDPDPYLPTTQPYVATLVIDAPVSLELEVGAKIKELYPELIDRSKIPPAPDVSCTGASASDPYDC